MYMHFTFKDGSNPYIAITEDAFFRMICKYELSQDWTNLFTVNREIKYLTVKKKLSAYEKAKTALREFAMNWQYDFERFTWYYSEIAEMQAFFETYGRKYGLLREFRENGIC